LAIATAIMANNTFVGEKKHPSRGGNPYSQDMRDLVITRYQLGLPLVSPDLDELNQEYQYPSVVVSAVYPAVYPEGSCSTKA
jgi:hypothetical protein